MDTYCYDPRQRISPSDKMWLQFQTEIKPVIAGTYNYEELMNKPRINGISLVGDKTNEELLIEAIPNEDLEKILK